MADQVPPTLCTTDKDPYFQKAIIGFVFNLILCSIYIHLVWITIKPAVKWFIRSIRVEYGEDDEWVYVAVMKRKKRARGGPRDPKTDWIILN